MTYSDKVRTVTTISGRAAHNQPAYVFLGRLQSAFHSSHATSHVGEHRGLEAASPRASTGYARRIAYLSGSLVFVQPGEFDTKLLSPSQPDESTAAYVSVSAGNLSLVLCDHSNSRILFVVILGH